MKVEFPDHFSLDYLNNKFLWRYLDLPKLLDLLNSEQIYFARLDNFEDNIEGITGKNVSIKFKNQSTPLTPENINKKFDEETQARLIQEDKLRREEYLRNLSTSQETQFASCWYLGDRESLAMWKIYSKNDGVAVKFNARELTNILIIAAENYTGSAFDSFIFGPVVYKNIWPFDPNEIFDGKYNALKKDKSYSHESEFRFIVSIKLENKGKYTFFQHPIGKLSDVNFEIVTNPYLTDYLKINLYVLTIKR